MNSLSEIIETYLFYKEAHEEGVTEEEMDNIQSVLSDFESFVAEISTQPSPFFVLNDETGDYDEYIMNSNLSGGFMEPKITNLVN